MLLEDSCLFSSFLHLMYNNSPRNTIYSLPNLVNQFAEDDTCPKFSYILLY